MKGQVECESRSLAFLNGEMLSGCGQGILYKFRKKCNMRQKSKVKQDGHVVCVGWGVKWGNLIDSILDG